MPRVAARVGARSRGSGETLEVAEAAAPVRRPGDDVVIGIEHVTKRFGDFTAVDEADFAHPARRVLLDARTVGLRQDDDAADDRRLRAADAPGASRSRARTSRASRRTSATSTRSSSTTRSSRTCRCSTTSPSGLAVEARARRRDGEAGRASCSRSCGSSDFADRKPGQLSGGQQQRVALARALVNYPSALLLDEPLGALDLKLRQAMQLELKRIQREVGITFVYVTHDQEEALTMSDRIAVMNDGQGRADRHARGDLQLAGVGVRRRVHRCRQPAARDGATPCAATKPTSRSPAARAPRCP